MAGGFQSDIPPAVNQTAKKYIRGMMKGRHRWNKLYGSRSKEVMHKTANKMAMGEMQKMPPTYYDIYERAKSKAQQRFFGMVRAAQKGEMDSPSSEVSKAASSMSKGDVKKYAKTKHDKLPERKKVEEGNKSGDSSLRDWFGKSKSSDGKPGWVQLGGKYAGKPCAKQPGQTTKPKCGSSKMKRNLNKDEEEAAFRRKNAKDPNPDRKGKAINVKTEETINERGDFWHPDPDKDRKLGGPGANQRAREDRSAASKPKSDPKKLRPGESYMDYAKRQKAAKMKKEDVQMEGKKDACYHKVKSRYSVWPSAYASGALVKCRKAGAKNWGNKSKKEEFEGNLSFQQFQEKCWKGYKRVGMKKKGNKMVPNCVPEEVQNEGAAWTKKSGKNSEGGLNEKGRKSYERENPGSDLKAPSKKAGNPRRASFCARMKGMKKKLTSSKTANDPDSRINKSLRAWNCK